MAVGIYSGEYFPIHFICAFRCLEFQSRGRGVGNANGKKYIRRLGYAIWHFEVISSESSSTNSSCFPSFCGGVICLYRRKSIDVMWYSGLGLGDAKIMEVTLVSCLRCINSAEKRWKRTPQPFKHAIIYSIYFKGSSLTHPLTPKSWFQSADFLSMSCLSSSESV
jgi:hypothetical protein